MHRIRPWLFIGKYRETLDQALLRAWPITAILHFIDIPHYPGITYHGLLIDDGQGFPPAIWRSGSAFLHEQYHQGRTILIACGAGLSRSVSFGIVALREIEQLPLLTAYRTIKAVHADALPHPQVWESLCAWYGESIPFLDLLRTDTPDVAQ